jgi:hypothetical protein
MSDVLKENSSLPNAFTGDRNAFGSHSDAPIEEHTRIGVPRQLSAPVLTGDRHLMTPSRTDGNFEGAGNPAIDLVRLVSVRRSLVIYNVDLDSDRLRPIVLHGEIETAVLLTTE